MAAKMSARSVVNKLVLRETQGSLRPVPRAKPVSLVKTCSCIPLQNILDTKGLIQRGHVLLGFTKDGRYLISYKLMIDAFYDSPLPQYVYSLHWWEFDQRKPLVQVYSVPLFEEEEIQHELHLIVSQTPDESQVIVWGINHYQNHECFVTVCSAPPHKACSLCAAQVPPGRCLQHSYIVHLKYDLLSPYPVFIPSLCLRLKNVILFNTGDQLVALTVNTRSRDLSERVVEDTHFQQENDKGGNIHCHDMSSERERKNDRGNCSSAEELNRGEIERRSSVAPACHSENISEYRKRQGAYTKRSHLKMGFIQNQGSSSAQSPPSKFFWGNTCTITSEANTKDDEKNQPGNLYNRLPFGAASEAPELKRVSEKLMDSQQEQDSSEVVPTKKAADYSEKCFDCFVESAVNEGGACDVSGTTEVKRQSASTVFSYKVYAESNNDENDSGLSFVAGVLPINATAFSGKTLKCLWTNSTHNPSSCSRVSASPTRCTASQVLVVNQTCLDIEQCINELIQSHEALWVCYKSLRDYDVQIVDVCPDSSEVTVLVRVLLYTRTASTSTSCGLPVSPSPILQTSGFVFSWNVQSGSVKTIKVMELSNFSANISKFNQATKEVVELRKHCAVPVGLSGAVRAFSNHTTFSGKSLKYIRHPHLPLAIVL